MKTFIIGAGSDLGVHIDGSALGPVQLINDMKSFYEGDSITILQDENIIKSRNLSDLRKNEYELEEFNQKIYQTVEEKLNEDYFPILIGGDSTTSIPIALASAKKHDNIGMIYFSPYASYNSFDTTVTGNLNDLSLAAITGYKNHELRYYHDGNVPQATKTVAFGVRKIEGWEKDNIKYSGLNIFTDDDVKTKGLENAVEEAFKIALEKTNGVHISFNLCLLDPGIAPGVSIPIFDGLTEEEVMTINKVIINHIDDIVSYDIVEFNPLRDSSRKTEQIAVNLIAQVVNAVNFKNNNK